MRIHPLTLVGVLLTVGGWIWLVFGVGIDVGPTARSLIGTQSVVNLQLLALAEQTCMLGYVLVIAGVLVSGFEWVRDGLPRERAPAPVQPPVSRPHTNDGPRRSNLDTMSGAGYKFKAID